MKKLLIGLLLAVASFSAFGQAVIRGEASAGVYVNLGALNTSSDATSTATIALPTGSFGYLFNGTTWDRWRSDTNSPQFGTARVSTFGQDACASTATNKQSTIINITTAATTALVVPGASQTIYVCAYTLTISQVITTANTLKFIQGTGASCAGAPADLTGLYGAGGVTAAAPIVIAGGGGTLFKTSLNGGLCAVTAIGATGSFQGVLTYVQQ